MFVDGFAEDFFIDAYAASGLAGTNDYAVLLTNGEDLTPETAAWLDAAAFAQEGGVDVYCMPKVTEAACEAGVTATGGDPADLQTVTIEDGLGPVEQDIAAVDITDAPATVTTGSDFDLEVTVTDADDEGIAEQAVTLSTDPDSDLDDEVAITDADGVAVFTDLTFTEAGEYDVTATAGEVSDTVTITATAPTDGGGGGVTPPPPPPPGPTPEADEVINLTQDVTYTGASALLDAVAAANADDELLAGTGPFTGGVDIAQADLSIDADTRTAVIGPLQVSSTGVEITGLDLTALAPDRLVRQPRRRLRRRRRRPRRHQRHR